MDSSSVTQNNSESDTFRFEVDDVVAEKRIEVNDELSQSPSNTEKTLPLSKRMDETSDGTKSENESSALKSTDDSGEQESSVSVKLLGSSDVRNTDENKSVSDPETREDHNPDETKSSEASEAKGKESPDSDSDENPQSEYHTLDEAKSAEATEAKGKESPDGDSDENPHSEDHNPDETKSAKALEAKGKESPDSDSDEISQSEDHNPDETKSAEALKAKGKESPDGDSDEISQSEDHNPDETKSVEALEAKGKESPDGDSDENPHSEDHNPDETKGTKALEAKGKENPDSDSDESLQSEAEKDTMSPVKVNVGSGEVENSKKIQESATPDEKSNENTGSESDEDESIKEKINLSPSKGSPGKTTITKSAEDGSEEEKSNLSTSKESPKKPTITESEKEKSNISTPKESPKNTIRGRGRPKKTTSGRGIPIIGILPMKTSRGRGRPPKKTTGPVSVEDVKQRNSLRSIVETEVVKSVELKANLETRNKNVDADDQKPRRGRKRKEAVDKVVEVPSKKRPQIVIAAKPKPYNLYPKGNSRLDSFIEVKRELEAADLKHLKVLHRLLHDEVPPRDVEELKAEILQFQGFTFNKRSDELEKRQKFLKKSPESTVLKICKILDLKEGTKDDMISDIIKFLLKPIKIVFCAVDPFQPNLQPVVKLDRLSLEERALSKVAVKSSKRKRMPSTRLSEYVSDVSYVRLNQNLSESEEEEEEDDDDEEKDSTDTPKPKRGRPRKYLVSETEKGKESSKKTGVDSSKVSQKSQKTAEKSKLPLKPSNMNTQGTKKPRVGQKTELQKYLAAKFTAKKRKAEVKSEPLSSPDESEVTLSSDEAKQEEAKLARRKKPIHRRQGKPLSSFNQVKENIMKANYSALQRLHILLFGASDKVENLKANILAFGGFPFLEGSEEWKQKEFLLSLLAPNTLKEYLNLLCIGHSNDNDNPTLINKLMKFLAAPKENIPGDNLTQVVSSEPVIQVPGNESDKEGYSMRTRNASSVNDQNQKTTTTPEKQKKPVKKLSVKDLKDLQNEYKDQKSKPKGTIKICQANHCTNNSKDNPELTYFSYPTDPVRLEKWLTNIELKPSSKKYNLCLCSKHFDCRAFTNTYKNKRLLTYAVPTIPAPGSTRKIVYPCLDGYASPDSSRLIYEPPGDKTEASTSGQSSDTSRVPLQKLMEDLTQKRTSLSTPQTDGELLEALLQTVYKRRALKEAGAKVSIPNKGTHTRLGELDNVKFLVVTANYNDLDVLHHLIYMTEATKSKVRKNILDFAGFNFAEDSTPYKDRMAFLESLGYNISKRIAFLLGLCPFKLDIDQQDLNELIMYFLMSPCKSKQIPIRHLPQNFFTNDMPEELCSLLEKHAENDTFIPEPDRVPPIQSSIEIPDAPARQKAKKSFRSAIPKERNVDLTPKPAAKSEPGKKPLGIGEKTPVPLPFPTSLLKASTTSSTTVKPNLPIPQSLLKGPPGDMGPQEFLIQQQTPDGQQKTYKLIRLPTTHPLNTSAVAKSPAVSPMPLRPPVPVPGAPLPPGIILFKNSPLRGAIVSPGGYMSPMNPTGITNKISSTGIIPSTKGTPVPRIVTQTTPVIQLGAPNVPVAKTPASPAPKPVKALKASTSSKPEKMSEDSNALIELDDEIEEMNPLDGDDPTDEDLYDSIQEIIHNSNFEDITLRNVIDRVSAQYAAFDLRKRHGYMKECVKKIIIGA